MADADDKLDFCKQALGELGTRSTITSLDPPDGSQEAYYCNLFFDGTRDQILRAAHWNFAANTDRAPLWKAQPGTPENPTPWRGWSNRDPAPRWLYSYAHKNLGIVQVRRVREGLTSSAAHDAVPLFSGEGMLGAREQAGGCVPFEIASDYYDRAGNELGQTKQVGLITVLSPGSGYRGGDYLTMTGDAASLMAQPVTLGIVSVTSAGGVVRTNLNSPGSFNGTSVTLSQSATTGSGAGFTCSATLIPNDLWQKVILCNAREIIVDYTHNASPVAQYDPLFADAFMLALEGKLALALIGDRALYTAKLQEANNSIINARVRDGNEGLTTYDHVPDWLQVRGVASMASAGEWFNPPYGPLFAV